MFRPKGIETEADEVMWHDKDVYGLKVLHQQRTFLAPGDCCHCLYARRSHIHAHGRQ